MSDHMMRKKFMFCEVLRNLRLFPFKLQLQASNPFMSLIRTVQPQVVRPQNRVAQASIGTRHQSVDDIVRNQLSYAKICEEQSAIFRQHVEEFTKEYALYTQSANVAKPGLNWKPSPNDRDAYIEEMERRCRVVPHSMAE